MFGLVGLFYGRICLLTQSHLISQYPIQSPIMHSHKPVQTNVLVLSQFVFEQEGNRGLDLSGCQGYPFRLELFSHCSYVR